MIRFSLLLRIQRMRFSEGTGLHRPSGLFLDGDKLYIAEEARILRVGFDAQARKVTGTPETILPELPHGGDHFTRTIKKGPDGFFYLTIGSSCNVCIEKNPGRAAMVRFKPGEPPRLFASGLRNTVGFDWQPGCLLYTSDAADE